MKADLEKILKSHDIDTTEYLDSNRSVIFKAIIAREPFPKGIEDYLALVKAQRDVIVDAISKLDAIDPVRE